MTNGKIIKHHVVLRLTQYEINKLRILAACAEETKEGYLTRVVKEHMKREGTHA